MAFCTAACSTCVGEEGRREKGKPWTVPRGSEHATRDEAALYLVWETQNPTWLPTGVGKYHAHVCECDVSSPEPLPRPSCHVHGGGRRRGGASRWNYWVDRNRPTMRSCDLWYEVGFFLWLEAVEHAGWLPPSSPYSTAQENKLHGNCARPGNCRMPPPSTTCHIRSESSDEMCSSHGNREKKSYDWLRAVHDTDSKKKQGNGYQVGF